MRPVDQEFLYQETPRVYGDCMRASIASLLSLPIADVPHFVALAQGDSYETYCLIEDFLFSRGYDVLWQINLEDHRVSGTDTYHLMSGLSPRGISHMVVGRNGEVFHDPHPSRAGLLPEGRTHHVIRNFKSTI